MTTRDFLAALAANPDAPLHVDPGAEAGGPVAPGYHVTEFKATTVHAVDCGGETASWNELVLQVVPPARPEARAMTAGKLLAIWRRVEHAVPVDPDAEVRVETAGPGGAAVAYLVDAVQPGDALTVALAAPGIACKERDRTVGHIPRLEPAATGACCAPEPAPIVVGAAGRTEGASCCG